MKKTIKCCGCGHEYSFDLTKYGGKKVKCKQCEAIIAVPSTDEDEFEIVEDAGPAPVQPAVVNGPPASLDAVAFKRSEPSRADIRRAVLESLGTWKKLTERRSAALSGELEECRAKVEEAKGKISSLRAIHSKALAYTPRIPSPFLTSEPKVFGKVLGKSDDSPDELLYQEAVAVLGKPVRPMPNRQPDMSSVGGFFKGLASNVTGETLREERRIRIETVEAAIKHLEVQLPTLEATKVQKQQQLADVWAEESRLLQVRLTAAQQQIAAGKVSEAQSLLEQLLRDAPGESLGQVFTALSQCAFASGNARGCADMVQKAICFGALQPPQMRSGYYEIWHSAAEGLPDQEISPAHEKLAEGLNALAAEDYAHAVEAFNTAINQGAGQAEAFVGRGKAYLGLAQQTNDPAKLELAAKDFKQANALNPQLALPDLSTAKSGSSIDWGKVGSVAGKVGMVAAGVLGVMALGFLSAAGRAVAQQAGGSAGSVPTGSTGRKAQRWQRCTSCGGKGFQNLGTSNERRCPSCGGTAGAWVDPGPWG